MSKFLSHFSAASFWDVPYLEIVAKNLSENTGDKRHFTYTDPNIIWKRQGIISHRCCLAYPPKSIIKNRDSAVASPELVFLQLATQLNIHQLILLGLQLCSHPPGKVSEAISSKRKLKNFLAKVNGHMGKRKAERALKYVENGSASIMESLVYMILTLPNFMGGYGFKGATFNHKINLNLDLVNRLGQENCFIDLYFKDKRIGVEYDSFEWHNSPASQGKDALRAGVLKRQGIEIFSMTTIQLYDEDACRDFAHNLALKLGRKLQIRTDKFEPMHQQLRILLPSDAAPRNNFEHENYKS